MLEKLNLINRNKQVEHISRFLIIPPILLLISIIATYYSTKLNLTNPLIPKDLISEILQPYVIKGTILTIGILLATTLKIFKQNLIAIIICVIIIAFYYLTNFQENITEYQK